MVCRDLTPNQRAGRLKQWLNYLRKHHPEGQRAFDELRESNDPARVEAWLRAQTLPQEPMPVPAAEIPVAC